MDYLKSKVVRAESPSSEEDEEDEESEDEAVNCDEGSESEEEEDSCTSPAQQDGAGTRPSSEQGTPSGDNKPQEARAKVCVEWGALGLPGR